MSETNGLLDEHSEADLPRHEVHLSDYWAVIVKHRLLVIACTVLAVAIGVGMTLSTQPMYRATVVLDIVRQSTNPLGFAGVMSDSGSGDAEFLPSQIELLKSRDVAERVARNLKLPASPAFNPEGAPTFVDKNGQVRQPTAQELLGAAMEVMGDTDATVVRGTSLVRVSYDAPSGKLAADIANALADAYIEWNIESRFRQIGQSAQFLASQIEEAKRDIAEKEKGLLSYARKNDILAADPRGASSQKLDSLNRDYAAAVTDRVAKDARYQELQNTPAEAIAETAAGGMLAQLRSDQDRMEREYADKLAVYKPEWPAMQQLKKQVEEGRQRIQASIQDTATKAREAARSDSLVAMRRETSLKEMIRAQQSEAATQGASASEYSNLRVEVDTKRALLDSLLKQQGEAEVLSRLREGQLTNIRIVDRALPPGSPYKPSLPRNVGMSFVLGAGLGVGLAFVLSYLDRSLRTADQVERYLQLPTLGAIPMASPSKTRSWRRKEPADATASAPGTRPGTLELLPHTDPRSAIAEAYRAFRTSLLFSRAGGVRIIGITSVLPQEGKSATTVNIAVSLAQLGRRVLIVDADLHRSRVHQILGVTSTAGLVSILAEGVEPSRVIVKTNIPGIFVVPAGPETPNPSGLLSSEDMQKFLELAASNFDHVVVDSPPVLATSDVLVFGQHTDGVVLCLRAGQTPRDQARRVREKLLRAGVPILGVLLNGISLDSDYYGGHEYRHLNYGERPPAPADGSGRKQPTATEAG